MHIGPLEYVVIGVPGQKLTGALISELNAIQESGQIRVVDLIFATKEVDGSVKVQEVNDLIEQELEVYSNLASNLMGLLTSRDIEQLTEPISPDSSAFIILLEHTWVIELTHAVRRSGGVAIAGGMVSHEILAHVSAELAAGVENQNA